MDPEDAEIAKSQGANKGNSGSASPWLSRKSRWDETPPTPGRVATPTPKRQISRWDEKPATMGGSVTPTPAAAAYTPGVTLSGGVDLAPGAIQMRAGQEEEEELTPDEQKEREISELVFKFKNETHPQWEIALGQLTDRACEFGAGPLFNYILPLFSNTCLQVQERRLLVKVIDRVLYKLDELVKPYVHEILVVIKPLLVDEDYNARLEGRAIISSLSKVAGLDSMIAAMRPDIDDTDECVRNTAARGFSIVASALGVPALLHFLKAVCQSRNNWQSRHTGIKIVHQIAVLIGSCSALEPHLKSLVEIVKHGLNDENEKVRTITALSLAALAKVAASDGIKSFDSVVKPLCEGIKSHRGKVLAAFLKAIGFVIPLMDAKSASIFTKEVMVILIREFQSPDEGMKKIVLKVVKQCMKGLEADFIRTKILPEFYRNFWVGMAFCPSYCKQLVETTVEISNKAGVGDIVARVAEEMKDESEPYRRMVVETIEKLVGNLGPSDIDDRLEELLIDGIFYAFLEQTSDDASVMLNGFGAVVNSLGQRVKPYLPQICETIEGCLKNESAKGRRQQAADLISRIAVVMEQCHEQQLVIDLGVLLYGSLGEENPEVLGSILGALKAIVNATDKTKMASSIKELLPRLTPCLKNRHEKVQENCIDLVGHIIERGAEFVPALELMRICFDLVEMMKSHKKGIRLAAVNTFGDIAKAIGPQSVLAKLLNNLKVQERRNRVCTTVAMSVVAEKCSPGIVLTALMNEYWGVPELNDVQNWVLKSLSFLFEYISEPRKEYVYVVIPLLEDALKHPDAVHRQGAAFVVKHMALRVVGLGCEDGLVHILNYLWPNIFDTSPFVLNAVMEAIEGMRVALGAPVVLNYCLQGLFHPSRKVRKVYWKIYNSLCISAQDALVAAHPVLEDEGDNVYSRPELTMFV